MKFRDMATEITEQEVEILFYTVMPDAIYKRFQRRADYIRVWYSVPNDIENIEHKIDFLPDDVYFVDDVEEYKETPLENGDILFRYHQFMIARGCSFIWKGNPYIL